MAKSKRGSNRYTVNIPKPLEEKLLKACEEDKITFSELIRESISVYLDIRLENRRKDDPK
jgi:hypothetical protein